MAFNKFPDYPINRIVKEQLKQPSLQPIPVCYRGYRFRSRLEGRWAVFFDALRLEFQYEPQGFRLPDGVCYLPDFYLPKVRCFAEVKPNELTPEQREACELLVCETGIPFLFLVGPPDFRPYDMLYPECVNFEGPVPISLDVFAYRRAYCEESRFWSHPDELLTEDDYSPEYLQAVHASRAARFEA